MFTTKKTGKYVELKTIPNGDCAYNAIAQAVTVTQSKKVLKPQKAYSEVAEHIKYLFNLYKDQPRTLQTRIAPILRFVANDVLEQKPELYTPVVLADFADFCDAVATGRTRLNSPLTTQHVFMQKAFSDFYQDKEAGLFKDEYLIKWWELIGARRYFAVMKQPSRKGDGAEKWASDIELNAIGQALGIVIEITQGDNSEKLIVGRPLAKVPNNIVRKRELVTELDARRVTDIINNKYFIKASFTSKAQLLKRLGDLPRVTEFTDFLTTQAKAIDIAAKDPKQARVIISGACAKKLQQIPDFTDELQQRGIISKNRNTHQWEIERLSVDKIKTRAQALPMNICKALIPTPDKFEVMRLQVHHRHDHWVAIMPAPEKPMVTSAPITTSAYETFFTVKKQEIENFAAYAQLPKDYVNGLLALNPSKEALDPNKQDDASLALRLQMEELELAAINYKKHKP